MLELFLFVEGVFAVLLFIVGMGRLSENKKSENLVYEHIFFKEIERQSPQMYKILTDKTRKINETEEKWIYDILKELVQDNKKYGSDATEILREFKKNVLDECTERPDYGKLSPQSRKYDSMKPSHEPPKDAYTRVQNELHEIESVVLDTRTKLAEEEEKNRHFPEYLRNEKLGIDEIQHGSARRLYDAKEKIRKDPYGDLTEKEALEIKSNIEASVSKGDISPEIAEKYIKGCEKAAGIKRKYTPTKEEAERQENILKSDAIYSARQEKKKQDAKKEREKHFLGPGKGREIAEHESSYQKIKKLFSR